METLMTNGGNMPELIERWERMAARYESKASDQTNAYTAERLMASADTFRLCADELCRELLDPRTAEEER